MKSKLILVVVALSLLVVGCGSSRSDPRAVAEAFFRAEMAKDEKRVLAICGNIGCPNQKIWNVIGLGTQTMQF